VTGSAAQRVDIAWDETTNLANQFKIERATATGPFIAVAVISGARRSLSDTGVRPNNTYTYRVVSINGCGYSTPSASVSVITP
jgi:hypothetical protein